MNNKVLCSIFFLSSVFLILLLLSTIYVYAQESIITNQTNIYSNITQIIVRSGPQISEGIKGILISLGLPPEVTKSWTGFFVFFFFPFVFFTAILGSIFNEIFGNSNWIPVFKNSKISYLFAALFVYLCILLGLITPILVWLYASASALALYITLIVFVGGIINKSIEKVTKWRPKVWESVIAFVISVLVGYVFGVLSSVVGIAVLIFFHIGVLIVFSYLHKYVSVKKAVGKEISKFEEFRTELENLVNKWTEKEENIKSLLTHPEYFKRYKSLFELAGFENIYKQLETLVNEYEYTQVRTDLNENEKENKLRKIQDQFKDKLNFLKTVMSWK